METKEKDKKYSIIMGIMILLFLIVVGITVAWGLGYIHFGKQVDNKDEIPSEIIDNKEDISDNVSNEVIDKPNNESQTQETVKDNKNTLKEAYKKYKFDWISKNRNENTYVKSLTVRVVIDERIYDVSFDHGEPIYSCPLPGHDFHGITVVNKNGEAYIGNFENGNFATMTYTKVNISEKIVDVCYGGDESALPYSGPYYMTETGKVLDRFGNTYDQINRNHIASVGDVLSMVYVCEDGTIDILLEGEETSYNYIKAIDANKNNIKAKYVFYDSQDTVFYIVAENNKLYKINNMTTGLSSIVNEKTVGEVSYNYFEKHMIVRFTDNTKFIYDEIYEPYELENERYMQ